MQLFGMLVFCTDFMCSQFGFVIFCQKEIGAKAACIKVAKLTLDGRQILRFVDFFYNFIPEAKPVKISVAKKYLQVHN